MLGQIGVLKPHIPQLTVVCVDCTPKVFLALKAIIATLKEISPGACKLLTSQPITEVPLFDTREIPDINLRIVGIPPITSLEEYSRFMIRELHKYVETSHCLVIQSDGYVLNGQAWNPRWLEYAYAGAPFNPSSVVGNGGFSLRSKKLLTALSRMPDNGIHPEDAFICLGPARRFLEEQGLKFMPFEEAQRFAFEGRSWNTKEWSGVPNKWEGQFGFHSLLSVLPPDKKPCRVFHHSGDAGDVIYGLATMKALGGGALFLSPHNNYPWPKDSRWTREGGEPSFVENLSPLLLAQDYVDRVHYTHGTPFSTDYDLNKFREPWRTRSEFDTSSIWLLHQYAFGLALTSEPWLKIPYPMSVDHKPIVVACTERYRSQYFDWSKLVQKYGDMMMFVGTEEEHHRFSGFTVGRKPLPHCRTKNTLELAEWIAGAKVFIGNQSLPLAIAHGLGKRVIVECWEQNPNCCLPRGDDAIYCRREVCDIPDHWLK